MPTASEQTMPDSAATPVQESAVPDSHGIDLWQADPAFARLLPLYMDESVRRLLEPQLKRLGVLGGGQLFDLAQTADKNTPVLHPRNRRGQNEQRIEYHPAYREMERLAYGEFGIAAMSHRAGVFGSDAPLPPIAKYALVYLFSQAEFGLMCPVSMTDSLTRTLRKFGGDELVQRFLPMLTSQDMDSMMQGAMFMTEQAAGSDVAATQVTATEQSDGRFALSGDKWFCSNPDAELAFVLARPDATITGLKGVALYLLPHLLDDGTRNHHRIVRLKDKLGTCSMASGEIDLNGALAWQIGETGNGFQLMADMVNNSRLSNAVRSAGMMRRAVTEALFVARNRRAFGKNLIDLPLMQRQLVKMLMRAEQARAMVFQTAEVLRCSDANQKDAYGLLRILTPMLKFRACRDARQVVGDAMEVRGGCGFIEEFPEPRLLRDAHLGSIWEGTSNIVALDVIRAVKREGSLELLRNHVFESLNTQDLPDFESAWQRAEGLVGAALKDTALTRAAASALYHLTSAAALSWEAEQSHDADRLMLAKTVLQHRVMPRDPLSPADVEQADWRSLLMRA